MHDELRLDELLPDLLGPDELRLEELKDDEVRPRSAIVAVLGGDALLNLQRAEAADMIELRLDLIEAFDPLEALRTVRERSKRPIIATARIASEGGSFQGSEAERSRLLIEASSYADFVDVELFSSGRDEVLAQIMTPAIISYHDFAGVPDAQRLSLIYKGMIEAGSAIAKIAVTPKSLSECLRLLQFLIDAREPLCLIGMGEIGRHLRAIAPIYGSALTYGHIEKSTAPGQMSLEELLLARGLFCRGLANWPEA